MELSTGRKLLLNKAGNLDRRIAREGNTDISHHKASVYSSRSLMMIMVVAGSYLGFTPGQVSSFENVKCWSKEPRGYNEQLWYIV